MNLESLRMLERILDSLIGGLAIYLGYLLFLKVPQHTDSQGKVTLPYDISIYMARVGPGVFFALFGAGVVALSLYHGISHDITGTQGNSAIVAQSTLMTPAASSFSGLGTTISGSSQQPATAESACAAVQQLIATLNRLPAALRPDLRMMQRADVQNALPRIKLAVMDSVWTPAWGEQAQFSEWVLDGSPPEIPKGLEKAAQCFNQGAEEKSK